MTDRALIDTPVLVHRFDPRSPDKRKRVTELLREGIRRDTIRLTHQNLVEFIDATAEALADGRPLLSPRDARHEAEDLMRQFIVLYPDRQVVRTALRGMAMYGFPWYDAHLWAHGEVHGLGLLYSETIPQGHYGAVRVANPFAGA